MTPPGSLKTGTDSFVSFILNLIKANATPANNTNIELVAITIKCLNPPVQARMKEKRHNVNMAIYGVVYFECTLANTLGKDPLKPPAKSTREKAMIPVNKLPIIEMMPPINSNCKPIFPKRVFATVANGAFCSLKR